MSHAMAMMYALSQSLNEHNKSAKSERIAADKKPSRMNKTWNVQKTCGIVFEKFPVMAHFTVAIIRVTRPLI